MESLSNVRPIFHSEADFQHAFAWEMHRSIHEAEVRLELPVLVPNQIMHIDLMLRHADECVAFELKYKTRATETEIEIKDETFVLADHGAQPPSRYDFWKDVERLEALHRYTKVNTGFAVLLTNDSAYWKSPRALSDTSAAFSLYDGRMVKEENLVWAQGTGAGTIGKRENPIRIRGAYCLEWCHYSGIASRYYPEFRYLLIEV